jgi:flagellar biosynthesis chaperone FliJ
MSERIRLTADGTWVDWRVECENAWEALRSMCESEEEFQKKLQRPYPRGLHQDSVTKAFMQYQDRLEEIIDSTAYHGTDEAKSLNEKARKYLKNT